MSVVGRCLQLVSRLLERTLVALRPFTLCNPPLHILPLSSFGPQLPGQNKLRRKQHHAIGHCNSIAHQKLGLVFRQ